MIKWLPRILAILFIAFLSIFALDVFSLPQWYVALFMHLLPSLILIVLTAIAWKYQRTGGGLFLIAGCVMAFFFHSLIIAAPAFVIGGLFLLSGYKSLH